MTSVFLDTVGLLAVWDTTDQWHAAAAAAYLALLHKGSPLITTGSVMLERGNAAARCPYRQRVQAMRLALMEDNLLVEPAPDEITTAWEFFNRGESGQAGIVDHISFLVMRRLA